MVSYFKIFLSLSLSSNLTLIFLKNMEWDCISFSALVKNSFQIFGPLTEIDYFVLVKENLLYLKLTYEKLLVYL